MLNRVDDAAVSPVVQRFDYLPVGLFGSVMGLVGLSVAWHLAHEQFGISDDVSLLIGVAAVVAFVVIVVAYAAKAIIASEKVREEFDHPIASGLFGTFIISLLLLPLVLVHYNRLLAQGVWAMGAVSMLVFAWLLVSRWISVPQLVAHVTPTWIVPVVGLLDLPLAMPAIGLGHLHGLMAFGLAVGLFFAVPLFTLNVARLMIGPPLPDALQPTLMLLIAPFAVGFSTYTLTTGQSDLMADALYMLTLFMFTVLVGRLSVSLRGNAFKLSWWAVSFPLAATAIAALKYADYRSGTIENGLAVFFLGFATAVIGFLFVRTMIGLVRGELRSMSV